MRATVELGAAKKESNISIVFNTIHLLAVTENAHEC